MKSILTPENTNVEKREREESEVSGLGGWENGDAIHIGSLWES